MEVVIEFLAAVVTGLGLAVLSAVGFEPGCDERRVETVVRKQAVSTFVRPVAAVPAPVVRSTIPC